MTITVQQSEEALPWLRGHSPAQYYTEHYLTSDPVSVLNGMDAKSKLTLFFFLNTHSRT